MEKWKSRVPITFWPVFAIRASPWVSIILNSFVEAPQNGRRVLQLQVLY
jgi:hypothetical protein